MPVVLKIDPRRQLVYSAFYGKITDEEMLGHRSRISSDPDFRAHFSEIVDFSAVTEAEVSRETIVSLAANPSLYEASALHIVVAPDDSLFELVGVFKQLAGSSRPNLFVVRSRAEAYQLLPGPHENNV
jgi:hypothetical protein